MRARGMLYLDRKNEVHCVPYKIVFFSLAQWNMFTILAFSLH